MDVLHEGQRRPATTWSVTNGVIHCTGQADRLFPHHPAYSNYFLTVEWRFVKIAPKADNPDPRPHPAARQSCRSAFKFKAGTTIRAIYF